MRSAIKTWQSQPKFPSIFQRVRRVVNPFLLSTVIAIVSLFVAIGYPVSSFAQILGSSQLNIERRGHTATLLGDGKVLMSPSGMVEIPRLQAK
jgi:hypothetical protein